MPVKKKETKVAEKSSKGGVASKKVAVNASAKSKIKKRNKAAEHHVHIIERDFIIITSGGFLVVVMVMFLLFS